GGGRSAAPDEPLKRRRDHRRRHDVLLDAANARDILGSDAQGLALSIRPVVRDPDVYDPAPDDDVGRPGVYPLLRLQFLQKLLADRAVVGCGIGGQPASRRRQRPYEVRPADDPDQLTVSDDRYPLDPFRLEQI